MADRNGGPNAIPAPNDDDGGRRGAEHPPQQPQPQQPPAEEQQQQPANNNANQPNNQQQEQQQQQQQQPRQIDADDGSDGEEDDEDSRASDNEGGGGSDNEDDAAAEDDDDVGNNEDGVLDGGVAGPSVVPAGGGGGGGDGNNSGGGGTRVRTRSTDCDLILLIETAESLSSVAPDNPILCRRGTTVSIGLDKSTKLMVVFARYCDFVNSQPLTPLPSFSTPPTKGQLMDQQRRNEVHPEDLEFVHVSTLDRRDTAEASALMKNDRIYVRRRRTDERARDEERRRAQREADREYFERMRHLLPDPGSTGIGGGGTTGTVCPCPCDVVFYCTGKLVDGEGYKQEVLTPVVGAHSAVISKRCSYLGRIIARAREEMAAERRLARMVPAVEEAEAQEERGGGVGAAAARVGGDNDGEEEHGGRAVVGQVQGRDGEQPARPPAVAVADDDSNNNNRRAPLVAGSPREVRPPRHRSGSGAMDEDDEEDEDDDGIRGLPYPAGRGGLRPDDQRLGGVGLDGGMIVPPRAVQAGVAEVEVDYDETSNQGGAGLVPQDSQEESASGSGAAAAARGETGAGASANANGNPNASNSSGTGLWIPLDHPPDAVRLLLEFCYTNRVISLGHEAFDKASLKPDSSGRRNQNGPGAAAGSSRKEPPVSPFSSRRGWPNGGRPTISMPVALAGIVLAEEACLPRLSLMCEVAASNLVTPTTVLEALALCQSQSQRSGNKLPILRKAAMLNHVLGRGHRGVSDLVKMPSFQRSLEEKSDLVVPSLLMGTMEAVKATLGDHPDSGLYGGGHGHGHHHHHHHGHGGGRGSRKRDMNEITRHHFKQIDEYDAAERESERRKRRLERWKKRRRTADGVSSAGGGGAAAAGSANGGIHRHDDVTDPYNLQRWNDEAHDHMNLQIALIRGEGIDMAPETRRAVHRIFSGRASQRSSEGGGYGRTSRGSAGGGGRSSSLRRLRRGSSHSRR